jgi:quercetin dioxygenase-like cupin family protein
VTVKSADANSRIGGNRCHGHARAFSVQCRGSGPDEGLVVAGRVAARLPQAVVGHHVFIQPPRRPGWHACYGEADEMLRFRASSTSSPAECQPAIAPRGDIMPNQPNTVPPDNLSRRLTVARPDEDQSLPHIGLVGDTYTILVTGRDTEGKYTLIDMHVPPGGGPPPHRHDFEEMFTVLDGEVRVTFRGETIVARAGQTVNVPANAPHSFTNSAGTPSRLLCLCVPAGQDEFFTLVGQPVATRTEAPPPLSPDAQAAFIAKSRNLAPRFKTELLPPPGDD